MKNFLKVAISLLIAFLVGCYIFFKISSWFVSGMDGDEPIEEGNYPQAK